MKVHTTRDSLHQALASYRKNSLSIGLVPTMGALHRGHVALVARAVTENEVVVVSIFVNPTQFDNPADLQKYPRTMDQDVTILSTLKAKIHIFAPSDDHLYNSKITSGNYYFSGLENEMEGKHRKGHFNGVGTVLNLLFRAVGPNKAYFGEKDFQQLQIVRKLVEIEKLPIEIVGCPIVRESNGLALSSRNKRLTAIHLKEAPFIYTTLNEVAARFSSDSIPTLTQFVIDVFKNHPNLELEYFEIANSKTLKQAKRKRKGNLYRAFIAVYAGEIRLIDNMALN